MTPFGLSSWSDWNNNNNTLPVASASIVFSTVLNALYKLRPIAATVISILIDENSWVFPTGTWLGRGQGFQPRKFMGPLGSTALLDIL